MVTARKIAECIASDASCAQGEYHQRVEEILGHLGKIARLQAEITKLRGLPRQRDIEEIARLRAALEVAWRAMRYAGDGSGITWREVEEIASVLGIDAMSGKPITSEQKVE